jgi:hypothetical protein
MQVFSRLIMARIAFTMLALWLNTGAARAGGGGADAGNLQTTLNGFCGVFGMTSCPQLPTASQLVLEIAGLTTAPPDVVRSQGALSTTTSVNAVNPPAGSPIAPAIAAPGSPTAPSAVTPLAFVSGASAAATQLGDPEANSFFYAATDGTSSQPPTVLNLVYDYVPLTDSDFDKGRVIARLTLPLVILNNDGSETEAPTTLLIRAATGCGKNTTSCISTTATGPGFGTVDAAALGLNVTLARQTSANSERLHAVIRVTAKLVVTASHDPAYFSGGPTFFLQAFVNNETGSPLPGATGIGIGPIAGPQCPTGGTGGSCGASHYPYCASIAENSGKLKSAVAAFLGIGVVGATYVTAPLQPLSGVTCPF